MINDHWVAKNLIFLSNNLEGSVFGPKKQDVIMKTRSSAVKSRSPTRRNRL